MLSHPQPAFSSPALKILFPLTVHISLIPFTSTSWVFPKSHGIYFIKQYESSAEYDELLVGGVIKLERSTPEYRYTINLYFGVKVFLFIISG